MIEKIRKPELEHGNAPAPGSVEEYNANHLLSLIHISRDQRIERRFRARQHIPHRTFAQFFDVFFREIDVRRQMSRQRDELGAHAVDAAVPVSYTHLDVYKRQQPPLGKAVFEVKVAQVHRAQARARPRQRGAPHI